MKQFYVTEDGSKVHSNSYCGMNTKGEPTIKEVGPEAIIENELCRTCFDHSDMYTALTRMFNDETGISDIEGERHDVLDERFRVVKEEYRELQDVVDMYWHQNVSDLEEWDKDEHEVTEDEIVEEMADLVFTLFSMANYLDMDLQKAFKKKSGYNLTKAGSEIVDGKVQDQSAVVKPLFDDCLEGY